MARHKTFSGDARVVMCCILVVGACAARPATTQHPQGSVADSPLPTTESVLNSLQFLEGCWTYWNEDWGFRMCWERRDHAWTGHVTASGMVANTNREMALRIAGPQTLHVETVGKIGDWFGGTQTRTLDLTAFADSHAVFTDGHTLLELTFDSSNAEDELIVRVSLYPSFYRLKRASVLPSYARPVPKS